MCISCSIIPSMDYLCTVVYLCESMRHQAESHFIVLFIFCFKSFVNFTGSISLLLIKQYIVRYLICVHKISEEEEEFANNWEASVLIFMAHRLFGFADGIFIFNVICSPFSAVVILCQFCVHSLTTMLTIYKPIQLTMHWLIA